MDEQRQDNQQEHIYYSSLLIQDEALKTYRERWTIETGGERRSGRSVLAVPHDDYISSQDFSNNDEEISVSIIWVNPCFRVFL